MSDTTCGWYEDEEGVWWTGCGHGCEMTTGTPSENGWKFCPYCGGGLTENQFVEEQA